MTAPPCLPGEGGCNPIGVHRPTLGKITPSRGPSAHGLDPWGRPGPMSQLAWRCFEGARPQKTAQIQVLADLWVPAFAGMAEEARVEIAALLVDSNWITASKAGTQ